MHSFPITTASEQDGTYPRPQLVRSKWIDISGQWEFDYDDQDVGLKHGWTAGRAFEGTIIVPFPPESLASGVGDRGYHSVLWYRRIVTSDEINATGHSPHRTLLLHFGAVDYRADVWANGIHLIHHEGGHTPFTATVPYTGESFEIVVRVEDDPHDLSQPRGKQDWAEHPHSVWYNRTSGIWQPVWLESVPQTHITHLQWAPDVARAEASLSIELSERPRMQARIRVKLHHAGIQLAEQVVTISELRSRIVISVDALRNGQAIDDLLWSPESPALVDASIEFEMAEQDTDTVASYLGFRQISESNGRFLLNERPYGVRGVLSQGYWPESHLAAPSAAALRAEVELIRELGFSTVRVHQKIEDPRFLYWTDRLGVLVWEEMPSVYEFTDVGSTRLLKEWLEVVRRDFSHPSIAVWVPFNESWGVHDIATNDRQRSLVRSLYNVTKSLDSTRLVISNDGWEHVRSDILTVHDYENDADRLLNSYGNPDAIDKSLRGIAPNGRRMLIGSDHERSYTSAKPVVLSEFGGVSVEPPEGETWGYRIVDSRDQLHGHLLGLFTVVQFSSGLAGWCYTQLTDTEQETNGLAYADRIPKLPASQIRSIVEGKHDMPPLAEPIFGLHDPEPNAAQATRST